MALLEPVVLCWSIAFLSVCRRSKFPSSGNPPRLLEYFRNAIARQQKTMPTNFCLLAKLGSINTQRYLIYQLASFDSILLRLQSRGGT